MNKTDRLILAIVAGAIVLLYVTKPRAACSGGCQ